MKTLDILKNTIPSWCIAHYDKDGHYGQSFFVMTKDGKGFFRLYIDKEEPSILTLCDLSVEDSARESGLGTKLLYLAEELCMKAGFDTLELSVEKDSWMQKWYLRNGFKETEIVFDPDLVTMQRKF